MKKKKNYFYQLKKKTECNIILKLFVSWYSFGLRFFAEKKINSIFKNIFASQVASHYKMLVQVFKVKRSAISLLSRVLLHRKRADSVFVSLPDNTFKIYIFFNFKAKIFAQDVIEFI